VFDLVTDEIGDICVGEQHIHVHGAFTLSGARLHVNDDCGAGGLDWSFGTSDMGMLKLIPIAAGSDAATSSGDYGNDLIFQLQ
jgi:hypothetical protein